MSYKRLPDNYCPNCGKLNDGASNLEDEEVHPSPGDVSVCLYCAQILYFDDNLKSQKMSPEELLALPDELRLDLMRHHGYVLKYLEGK